MSKNSALRLYRIGRRGRSVYLGSYVSVAVGILPEANPGQPRRGVHIQLRDATEVNPDHSLRGLPGDAEQLILDLAQGIAQARAPNGLRGGIDAKQIERTATIGVLMELVDRLSGPLVKPAHRIAAE